MSRELHILSLKLVVTEVHIFQVIYFDNYFINTYGIFYNIINPIRSKNSWIYLGSKDYKQYSILQKHVHSGKCKKY